MTTTATKPKPATTTKTPRKPKTAAVADTAAPAIDFGADTTFARIPIGKIDVNPANLRKDVGDVAELAESIRSVGVLQAVTVRPAGKDRYELVAGHRRHAAALQAGCTELPAMIRTTTMADSGQVTVAMVVENLQRRDLEPVEEAEGYERLVELGLTQRNIATRVGFSQSHIAKRLALRKLPASLQQLITEDKMTLATAEIAAAAPEEVRQALGSPAFIKNCGSIRDHNVRHAVAEHRRDQLKSEAGKSLLPEWPGGYNYDNCKKDQATHWIVSLHNDNIAWVKLKKPAARGTSKSSDNVDVRRQKAAIARATERREFVRPLLVHADLEDVAIKVLLMDPWIGLGIGGDDARIVLDWQFLRATLAKDTKTAASDAWSAQRTKVAISGKGGRLLFVLAVLSNLESRFTQLYSSGRSASGALYLRTLARHGWTLDDIEQKIVDEFAGELAPDSSRINQLVESPAPQPDVADTAAAVDVIQEQPAEPDPAWLTTQPWSSFASATPALLTRTIGKITKPEVLRHAIAYEHARDDRADVISALTTRLETLTGAV